jgi:VWFA-related protein
MRKSSTLFVLVAGLTAAALSAQSPPQNASAAAQASAPAIKVETRVVLVDIVVTGAKGEPIVNLKKDDFRIAEDGVPQRLSSFEEHKLDHSQPLVLPAMPANVYTNFPAAKPPDSVNVLLLDMLNTQPSNQAYVREQAVKYLSSAPAGTRVAIFALHKQLHLVRGFTTDFSGLTAALDDKSLSARPEVSPFLSTDSTRASENEILRAMTRNMSSPVKIDAVRDYEADRLAEMNRSRADITLEALQALAHFLSAMPERKNVIWFADSFPVSFLADPKMHDAKRQALVQQTSDLLTAGQVAIYPVSASGLVGDPGFQANNDRGPRERQSAESGPEAEQIAMETIAQDTGGRAFYGRNGLNDAFATAVNEGAQYYTLAYSPTDVRNDGKYRRIEVTIPASDYKLAYRRGYFADKPLAPAADGASGQDPLVPFIGFGLPDFDKIICKVEVSPTNPQPKKGAARAGANSELKEPVVRYGVNFAISVDDLALTADADGARHGHLEEMVAAYDLEGRILNLAKQEMKLSMGQQDYLKLRAIGLQLHQEIDVPPGEVILRVGIYDFDSGNAGTIGIPVSSPTPKQKAKH